MAFSTPSIGAQTAQQAPKPGVLQPLKSFGGDASPALTALKTNVVQNTQKNAAGGAGGSTVAPDPTQYNYTPIDTTQSDAYQKQAIDKYNQTQDASKQLALNALSASQRGASENAARAGLSAGSASYLAANAQGQINGLNAANQQMMNWAQGASQVYQGAANNALNTAQANAAGKNQVSQLNTQYAQQNLQNQQKNTAAAQTAQIQTLTDQFNSHISKKGGPGWTGTSAASGDWNSALKAYYDAQNSNDPAAMTAALNQLNTVASGQNYTQDGHNRTDPSIVKKYTVKKKRSNPDGTYTNDDGNGHTWIVDANNNFIKYTGT